jgi:glycosyltransferase involved in cell wall biosynthesis
LNKKKKICLFNVTSTMARIGTAEVGGVETYSFRLAEALQRRGHEVVMYGGNPSDTLIFPAQLKLRLFPYIDTSSVPDLGTRFQRLVQRLHFAKTTRKSFLSESFDAVFIFKPYDFVTAWLWKRSGFTGRVVASLHGTEFYPFDHRFARYIDAFYAVTQITADSLRTRYGTPCEVIPNFLTPPEIRMGSYSEENQVILSVGRLVAMKGMDKLVRAFARIWQQIPKVRLVIAGDGPERSRLEKMCWELGVEGKVLFTGALSHSEVLTLITECSLYIQPSVGSESFSLSTLEALGAGRCVIASDKVAIARYFASKNCAVLYPAEDIENLANLLRIWLKERAEALAMGSRAAERVHLEFSETATIPKIEKAAGLTSFALG